MIKRNCLILYIIFLALSSCQKKPVQLPVIDIAGLSEIQNHSSIWIFLETEQGETRATLNKNNKILNTHWIFNIDRRLTMNQVIPILTEMQENRNKDSMHKKEGMMNYFSYADNARQKISLTPFPQTSFLVDEKAITDFKKNEEEPCSILLEIWGDQVKLNNEVLALEDVLSTLKNENSCHPEGKMNILLTYDGKTLYQDYLRAKTYLHSSEINCANKEYVYTVK